MGGKISWVVIPPDEAPAEPVEHSQGARMAVLIGPQQGAPRFYTRRFMLAPGGSIPAHRHATIEHQQVVVRGEMVMTLDGVERVVRAGDAVFIPAGTVHGYANRSAEEEVEFLCIVPATSHYHTEWLGGAAEGTAVGGDSGTALGER
jgi:quercetin dioxygenase-like cupin family protein